ncbi:MAG: 50S ribosomal protein L32 [Candidatus Harrisonbacteria bacterium CG10_big_fil_rev_8_21_14_0_10_45_28]|uniref:Large ribosomal subunit protein bL32 n=1 Tax=Candidatus Harrisonbacteria bacterium CG10_big_fil_rev_8_21_14_0_10_45_28 TaxID=1974586 RepID=A0A2H0UPA4_9BACT|nr:MAG: 50S ribosomal protein L32 [Candidatus Harrisonbacteria bacterium CG10_big_fil_rev_8_21_14_0_10_45_28]
MSAEPSDGLGLEVGAAMHPHRRPLHVLVIFLPKLHCRAKFFLFNISKVLSGPTHYALRTTLLRTKYKNMVPRKHRTKGGVGRRRAHLALKKGNIHVCSTCSGPRLPHKACAQCGIYNGTKRKEAVGLK